MKDDAPDNEFKYIDGIPPCLIYVDEEGEWYHKGTPIFRKDILEIFYSNLHRNSKGLYIVKYKNEECYIEVADTPFVVQQVYPKISAAGITKVLLALKNLNTEEVLDPSTLWVGEKNILYCLVYDGRFPARFSRPAYYELAKYIDEDEVNGGFYITIGGKRFSILEHEPPVLQSGNPSR